MSHADYKFSITIKSDDLAVVNCLRSLSQFSQQSGNNRIPWGRTPSASALRRRNSKNRFLIPVTTFE